MATIAIRDVSLFVKIVGRGYPLVLMHGGPGLDHSTLSSLQPLADRFTLIFYDHRANGRSSGSATSMTWDNLTADADALRQMLGFKDWAVLGHSFGGHVALEYALRYPDRVSHLMLMDTGGDAWWIQQNAADVLAKRGYRPATVEAARRFYNGQLTPDEVVKTIWKFANAYFYRFNPLGLVPAFRIKRRPEAHVFAFSKLLTGWSVMDRLRDISVPTLVCAGRHDFLFPPEHQAILADRLPHAQLEIVECAGHNPHDEQTGAVLKIMKRFLATAGLRRYLEVAS
ncbi:MAG TPA: alpha/beta hydrolase [Gemmatimonadales bacterium]|jgi:proline iminopeptidase